MAIGVRLDAGRFPFRIWSLAGVSAGGLATVVTSRIAAALYRYYRRKSRS